MCIESTYTTPRDEASRHMLILLLVVLKPYPILCYSEYSFCIETG